MISVATKPTAAILLAAAALSACGKSPPSTRAVHLKGDVTAYEVVTRSTFMGASGRQLAFQNPPEQAAYRMAQFTQEADTLCPGGHEITNEDLGRVTNKSISYMIVDIRMITCAR